MAATLSFGFLFLSEEYNSAKLSLKLVFWFLLVWWKYNQFVLYPRKLVLFSRPWMNRINFLGFLYLDHWACIETVCALLLTEAYTQYPLCILFSPHPKVVLQKYTHCIFQEIRSYCWVAKFKNWIPVLSPVKTKTEDKVGTVLGCNDS